MPSQFTSIEKYVVYKCQKCGGETWYAVGDFKEVDFKETKACDFCTDGIVKEPTKVIIQKPVRIR